MSSYELKMDLSKLSGLFVDGDIMLGVVKYLSEGNMILFGLINKTCYKATVRSGVIYPYRTQVEEFCSSQSLVQWAIDMGCPTGRLVTHCASRGHLGTLLWLRDEPRAYPWDESTCAGAARGGHLDVLKRIRGMRSVCPWNENTCEEAAGAGHLEVLQWAREQSPPCPWDEET